MKYVVYGLGISGISAAKYLAAQGFEVITTDDNDSNNKTLFEKEGGIAQSAMTGDLGQQNSEQTKNSNFNKTKKSIADAATRSATHTNKSKNFVSNHSLRSNSKLPKFDDKSNLILSKSPSAISGEIAPPSFSKRVFDRDTIISFSPGIPLYFPKRHKILEIVEKTGAVLACDIEIFYRLNSQNNFVGITGTNGKSTTTALAGFVFKELQIASEIGGNIGVPCFDLPQQQKNFSYIFETSSYQLDLLSQTHFKIAALLNITPDHLDRHGSLENYIAAKKRIFQNQVAGDFALIDVDCENSKKVFDQLKNDQNFHATLVPISTKQIQENGVALFDGILVNKIGGANSSFELKSQFLLGQHNDQNMAFAFAISFCHQLLQNKAAAAEEKIIAAIKKFTGLRHRLQLLGEIDGIKFVNDSKATNAESTENALKAYDKIFWILGGVSKSGGISGLTPYFKKIHKAYLIGEATENFAKILSENSVAFEKCGDLETAFKRAFIDAKNISLSQKSILLSPACASLDQWKNFEQRGDYFCKLFDELSQA